MIIIGAGNLGKHVLDQLILDHYTDEIFFFDENISPGKKIYSIYPVITNFETLLEHFSKHGKTFIAAIGHPRKRKNIFEKIVSLGGVPSTMVSSRVAVFSGFSKIGKGSVVQPGCAVSHNVAIGKSVIIHAGTLIGHDVKISDFTSIGSNVNILKNVAIGKLCNINPNVLILNDIKIGNNVYVGPGVTINHNLEDNSTLV